MGRFFLVGLNHSEANQGTCYGIESFGILDFFLEYKLQYTLNEWSRGKQLVLFSREC